MDILKIKILKCWLLQPLALSDHIELDIELVREMLSSRNGNKAWALEEKVRESLT